MCGRWLLMGLGELGDARAMDSLPPLLADRDRGVRQAVANALDCIDKSWVNSEPARHAIPKLEAAVKDKDYWVRTHAAEALARIGKPEPLSVTHSEQREGEAKLV